MEKKNTILLTVIAIATLLVAVVGATFAYFTASVKTTNDSYKTTTVTTKTLATATMDYGSNLSASNVLPGYKILKSVTITGDGPDDSLPVNTAIEFTKDAALSASITDSDGSKLTAFKNNIKYAIYNVENSTIDAGDLCDASSPVTVGTKYYDSMTCDLTSLGTAVAQGTFADASIADVKVPVSYNTSVTYYIYLEYAEPTQTIPGEEGQPDTTITLEQNDEQGASFSLDMTFVAKAA